MAAGGPTSQPHVSLHELQPLQPTLRVMRLFNPRLALTSVLPYCPYADGLRGGAASGPINSKSLMSVTDEPSFALSNLVVLPENFGAIYLGETFSGYISVLNQLPRTVLRQIVVQARLVGPNSKIEECEARLARGGEPLPKEVVSELQPGQHIEMIVERLLTEVGNYHLRIGITYTPRDSATGRMLQPENMKKVYRFTVHSPIQVVTKCINICGSPFAEVQITNSSKTTLHLESIAFLPEEGYTAEMILIDDPDKNSSPENCKPEALGVDQYDKTRMLEPENGYQVVYRISRTDGQPIRKPHPAVIEVSIGQLGISWTTAMGERGQMLTSPVSYKLPAIKEVDVKLEGIPARCFLGKVVSLGCIVTNYTEKEMDLQLQFRLDAMIGVYITGPSFQNLGNVKSGESVKCQVQFIATVGGLHPVKGIYIVDLVTGHEFDQGKFGDIFVES